MPAPATPELEVEEQIQPKKPGGPWNVVLWDDDFHTYDYVIEMLVEVCAIPPEKAFQHAVEVDSEKKTMVFSGEFEHAEHIHDRIINYGPDPRMPESKGSMTATLEQS
ncbi:MAG: ATP-dependent Clp protease adaptor ClpS [Spirochaetota bacterium]